MKKKIFIGLGVILIALIAFVLYEVFVVSKRSPVKTTAYSYQDLDLTVIYCQPSKRGRLIFGEEKDGALQPFGKYWRLGANAPTQITFNKNINFAGKPVNAGTYRMYTVPGPSSFQVSLNSEIGFSGASEPDYAKDILKVDVASQTTPETEQFVINFASDSTGVNMDFVWDKTLVRIPITINK